MLSAGELEALVSERVWQELSRGLMEVKPSRMFELLAELAALPVLAPELVLPWREARLALLLDQAADAKLSLAQRFAVLTHGLDRSSLQAFAQRWHAPNECNELAALLIQWLPALVQSAVSEAPHLVGLWERVDAKRKPLRFLALIECAQLLRPFDARRLLDAHQRLIELDEAGIAKAQSHPSLIRAAIHDARLAEVRAFKGP
jgi:tRNA nucleotidyltransferase (CCA-adding enzyme)